MTATTPGDTMPEKYDDQPLRLCSSCGKVDRAPRHRVFHSGADGDQAATLAMSLDDVLDAAPEMTKSEVARIAADYGDPTSDFVHIDCHAAQGCPLCLETHRRAPGSNVTAGASFAEGDKVTRDEALFRFIKSGKTDDAPVALGLRQEG